MQFSLRYDKEIWELTDHEKEVMILAKHWKYKKNSKWFPLTTMVFGASFTPKNCHVDDISQTRRESVYRRFHVSREQSGFGVNELQKPLKSVGTVWNFAFNLMYC